MSLTVNSGNDLSTLFSSFNNSSSSQSGTAGLSNLISEYNSIRNGSYAKLAKQYYSSDSTSKSSLANDVFSDTESSVSNKTQTLTKDSEIKANKELISDVSTFRTSLSGLKNDDTLFEIKADATATDSASGTASYDYDKIYSKLSGFAKAYNEILDNGVESDNATVLRNVSNMTKTVDNYKKQLESVGFTVNSDNTLSVSKDSIQSGDMKTVQSLFSKTSAFATQLDTYSTNVASQAASDVYSLGGYTSTGAYKQTLETIYNTTI